MNKQLRRQYALKTALSLLALIAVFLLSLGQGAGVYDAGDFLSLLSGRYAETADPQVREIFFGLRLPRAIAAVLVGGGLALSASLLQNITRNPLAEPGLLGVNAGAVLGLTIGLSYFAAGTVHARMLWSGGGALCAILIVLVIGGVSRRTSPAHLILIGIAASAALGGMANYILMSFDTALEQFRFWNLGSLSGVRMEAVLGIFPYFLAGCVVIAAITRWLGVMQLGDDQAKTMGVPTGMVTFAVWVTTAVLTACAISIAGPVMFAGFLAAYLARFAAGPQFALQIIYSALFGMTLVLAGDVFARWVIKPFEIPVGVIIALAGSPLTIAVARSRAFRAALLREPA